MARAVLAPTSLATVAGVLISPSQQATADGLSIAQTAAEINKVFAIVKNVSDHDCTVTQVTSKTETVSGNGGGTLTVADVDVTVAAGTEKILGPWDANFNGQVAPNQGVWLDFAMAGDGLLSDVTIQAFKHA